MIDILQSLHDTIAKARDEIHSRLVEIDKLAVEITGHQIEIDTKLKRIQDLNAEVHSAIGATPDAPPPAAQ